MTSTQNIYTDDFKISGNWEVVTKRLQEKFWKNLEKSLSNESLANLEKTHQTGLSLLSQLSTK